VNSLLERLRRKLRELGRPLSEGASSDGERYPSRADTGGVPQRRTEIEPILPRQGPGPAATDQESRLPAQQPPPPTSTRLRAAVLSKKRPPGPPRQSGSIWGRTSILDVGYGSTGYGQAAEPPLSVLQVGPVAPDTGLAHVASPWPTWPSPTSGQGHPTTIDPVPEPTWSAEMAQPLAIFQVPALPLMDAAASFDGTLALHPSLEALRPSPATLQLCLDFGDGRPTPDHRSSE
jgi:hypothetical protein